MMRRSLLVAAGLNCIAEGNRHKAHQKKQQTHKKHGHKKSSDFLLDSLDSERDTERAFATGAFEDRCSVYAWSKTGCSLDEQAKLVDQSSLTSVTKKKHKKSLSLAELDGDSSASANSGVSAEVQSLMETLSGCALEVTTDNGFSSGVTEERVASEEELKEARLNRDLARCGEEALLQSVAHVILERRKDEMNMFGEAEKDVLGSSEKVGFSEKKKPSHSSKRKPLVTLASSSRNLIKNSIEDQQLLDEMDDPVELRHKEKGADANGNVWQREETGASSAVSKLRGFQQQTDGSGTVWQREQKKSTQEPNPEDAGLPDATDATEATVDGATSIWSSWWPYALIFIAIVAAAAAAMGGNSAEPDADTS